MAGERRDTAGWRPDQVQKQKTKPDWKIVQVQSVNICLCIIYALTLSHVWTRYAHALHLMPQPTEEGKRMKWACEDKVFARHVVVIISWNRKAVDIALPSDRRHLDFGKGANKKTRVGYTCTPPFWGIRERGRHIPGIILRLWNVILKCNGELQFWNAHLNATIKNVNLKCNFEMQLWTSVLKCNFGMRNLGMQFWNAISHCKFEMQLVLFTNETLKFNFERQFKHAV